MAYTKNFNPDALPAHAQPDEAAQAMSQLHISPKPNNTNIKTAPRPTQLPNSNPRPPPKDTPPGNRPTIPLSNTPPYHHPSQGQPNRIYSPVQSGHAGWGSPRPHGQPQHQQPQQLQPQLQRPMHDQHYTSHTPAPLDPDSADLFSCFVAANVSKTGSLTIAELGSALVNADSTHFDPQTIRSLMRLFSSSLPNQPQGPTITYPEFQNLWRFLGAWRELFERFDEDRSGRISLTEFANALSAFGYRLSTSFVGTLYNAYGGQGRERRPSTTSSKGMSFDLFVQACINLKRMTDVFKSYDDDRDGYVSLSFEEFLTEIIRLRD